MAGHEELEKFVRHFVSLWESGSNARLHVETEAGNAFVSLQVGLGQAQPLLVSGQHHGGRRGGSPAKQRRRERRDAERQVKADQVADNTKSTAEEEVLVEEINVAEEQSEKDEIEYKLEIDAHVKCKGYDVVEAIEENYQGTLNDLKIDEQDVSRCILIQKLEEEPFEKDDEDENEKRRIRFVYKVIVKDNEVAKPLIESWKFRNKFDDLAFRHAVYDKVQIRIQKVQKI